MHIYFPHVQEVTQAALHNPQQAPDPFKIKEKLEIQN